VNYRYSSERLSYFQHAAGYVDSLSALHDTLPIFTYLPFIARATIDALKEFPVVNSSFFLEERKAIYHRSVNLGVAIDLNQQGLIVASVREADGLRLVGLARQISELAQRARSNKLSPDDVTGATFTITNPGPFGSLMSAPIINVPNVAILSTDTI